MERPSRLARHRTPIKKAGEGGALGSTQPTCDHGTRKRAQVAREIRLKEKGRPKGTFCRRDNGKHSQPCERELEGTSRSAGRGLKVVCRVRVGWLTRGWNELRASDYWGLSRHQRDSSGQPSTYNHAANRWITVCRLWIARDRDRRSHRHRQNWLCASRKATDTRAGGSNYGVSACIREIVGRAVERRTNAHARAEGVLLESD